MRKLIRKVWTYRPNKYTTVLTLTASWSDGTSSVYSFNRSGSSWIPSGTHDEKLLIYLPTEKVGMFRVRAYEDCPFVKLECGYGNSRVSKNTKDINLRRIVFDRSIDDEAIFYRFGRGMYYGNSIWGMFDENDLSDIYLTNLTESVTLPNNKVSNGSWDGWGLYNETCPEDRMKIRYVSGSTKVRHMPVMQTFLTTNPGFPVIGKEKIDEMVTKPNVNGVFKLLPLYEFNNSLAWWPYENDYNAQK